MLSFIMLGLIFRLWDPGIGQQSAPSKPAQAKEAILEARNPAGWKIPGLSHDSAAITGGRHLKGAERVEVQEVRHTRRSSMTVFGWADVAGRIDVDEQPVDVLNLYRHLAGGVTFGYSAVLGGAPIEWGRPVSVGSASHIYYYDPNGCGRFSIARWQAVFEQPLVPAWVERLITDKATAVFFMDGTLSVRVDFKQGDQWPLRVMLCEGDTQYVAAESSAFQKAAFDSRSGRVEVRVTDDGWVFRLYGSLDAGVTIEYGPRYRRKLKMIWNR